MEEQNPILQWFEDGWSLFINALDSYEFQPLQPPQTVLFDLNLSQLGDNLFNKVETVGEQLQKSIQGQTPAAHLGMDWQPVLDFSDSICEKFEDFFESFEPPAPQPLIFNLQPAQDVLDNIAAQLGDLFA